MSRGRLRLDRRGGLRSFPRGMARAGRHGRSGLASQCPFAAACTASDARAVANARSDIRRGGNQVGSNCLNRGSRELKLGSRRSTLARSASGPFRGPSARKGTRSPEALPAV